MIAAVIPVKRLAEAKSRMAGDMDLAHRIVMVRSMLEGVIEAIRDSAMVERIAVVTPEAGLAASVGVESLPDRGSLNDSLSGGAAWALSIGAGHLLVLPADLPLINAGDVEALLAGNNYTPAVHLACTRDGGTGGLLLTPPDAIPFAFGLGSFGRHLVLAKERGLRVRVVESEGLSFDLDTVNDLRSLRARGI